MLLRVLLLVTVCLALAELTVARIERRLRSGEVSHAPTRLARRATPRARHRHRAAPVPSPVLSSLPEVLPEELPEPGPSPRELAVAEAPPASTPRPARRSRSFAPPSTRAPEGVPTLTGQELEDLFLGSDDWLSRATFKRARMPDGTPVGIHVDYQGDTPLAGLGVRPGDILTSLNGHPLHSEDDYRWAGEELREASDFAVGVQRDGAPTVLRFRVTR